MAEMRLQGRLGLGRSRALKVMRSAADMRLELWPSRVLKRMRGSFVDVRVTELKVSKAAGITNNVVCETEFADAYAERMLGAHDGDY